MSSSDKNNSYNIPTEQELAWASRLKEAALAAAVDGGSIDAADVSDWEFLQHALIAKSDTLKALQRLKHLQALKRRYGIIRDGSVEEAARDLRTFLQTHPGLYLSLATTTTDDKNDDETTTTTAQQQQQHARGTQIFCSEYQNFQAARMKSEEAFAVYMRAAFYVLQASQSDLPALRAGMVLLMDMHRALRYRSFETEARARELYGRAYPIRVQRVVLLRASTLLRTLYRWLLQPWMSRKVKEMLDMPVYNATHSRQEYLDQQTSNGIPKSSLPQSWGGSLPVEDFYETILTRLRQRYHMVETFRL